MRFSISSWCKFIRYNFFCNKIISNSKLPLLIGRDCVIELKKNSRIKIKQNLQIGYREIVSSRQETRIRIMEEGEINVLSNFIIYAGSYIHVSRGGRLILGSGFINENVQIICGKYIEMGNGVAIGPDVVIRSTDAHRIDDQEEDKPIIIGNNVWVGQGAMILKGVTIGEGAIIGAKSLVTKDVPAHCVVAGNPARVVKENVTWK